jgi:hypothetical protein
MSKRKRAAKAAKAAKGSITSFNPSDVANIVTANPYIQRLLEDADLRENVRHAIDSTRHVYDRVTNGKTTVKSLVEDRKLQRELQEAVEAIRQVVTGLTEPGVKRAVRKTRRLRRVLLLGSVGGGVAVATNEGLRSKVLDALFGAEEEFNYTPPGGTTPATPAPAAPVTAA